jgi:DNA polymerase III alpha subunit (gram-positive type)
MPPLCEGLQMNHAIIFDTETTGLVKPLATPLDDQPQIIEFAAIKVDFDTLEEVDRLEFLVHPGRTLPEEIIKITGITDEMLSDALPFVAHIDPLSKFFLGAQTLIAHNLSFDTSLLRFDLMRNGCEFKFPWCPTQICTVEASFSIRNKRMRLCQLHELAEGAEHKDAHRAMADVEALVRVVKYLRKEGLL